MEFKWKISLAITVMCGISCIIVQAPDPSESNLTEDVGNRKTNKQTDRKEDGTEEGTAKMAIVHPYDEDAPSEEKNKKDGNKMRPKRSVNSNLDSTTAAGTKAEDEEKTKEEAIMRAREASAKLTKHLRNLPVLQEHTIPLVAQTNGQIQVPMYVSIRVLSVFEINDVKQTIKTGLYVTLEWHDRALAWNKSLNENVDHVLISPKTIWTPPLFVANSRGLSDLMENTKVLTVTYDGNITVHNAILLETSCSMDLSSYPYDEQTCAVKFLSLPLVLHWIVDAKGSDEKLSKSLALNSEWELTNVSTRLYLESGENPFPEVVVRLRRKTRFYSVCLILPMVVTSYMNTLVFVVPLQAGEKVSFLVTLYVSTSVFTSFFSTTMPRGLDSTPLSVKLLIGVIVESVLVMLVTFLVLRKFHAEQEAASGHSQKEDSTYRQRLGNNDPIKQLESSKGTLPNTTELHNPQPLQDPPKSRGVCPAWVFSRSQSVTPLDRASRATRIFDLRGLTSRQLDRILFIVFVTGNSIFLLALLHTVL